MAKYSKKAREKIETVMYEFNLWKLKSGKGFFNALNTSV